MDENIDFAETVVRWRLQQPYDVPWWIAADTLEAALAEINRLREKIALLEALERSRD